MLLLCQKAIFQCDHGAPALPAARQHFVCIDNSPVLVKGDPESRPVAACPNLAPPMKPCTSTLVADNGHSTFVSIAEHPVCLSTIEGYTDGTPPGVVRYQVFKTGQSWVAEA